MTGDNDEGAGARSKDAGGGAGEGDRKKADVEEEEMVEETPGDDVPDADKTSVRFQFPTGARVRLDPFFVVVVVTTRTTIDSAADGRQA